MLGRHDVLHFCQSFASCYKSQWTQDRIVTIMINTVFEKKLEKTIVRCLSGVLVALTNWAGLYENFHHHSVILGNRTMISNLARTIMKYSTCRYLTHAHAQNWWQQTNSSTLQKQIDPEQSLIEIYCQHLSYSLKLAVKKCITENFIKQPDIC